jgi:hypothetical protein
VAELAPPPTVNVLKWRQQARWYLAPLEQIIVKEAGLKTLADGSEVSGAVPRARSARAYVRAWWRARVMACA